MSQGRAALWVTVSRWAVREGGCIRGQDTPARHWGGGPHPTEPPSPPPAFIVCNSSFRDCLIGFHHASGSQAQDGRPRAFSLSWDHSRGPDRPSPAHRASLRLLCSPSAWMLGMLLLPLDASLPRPPPTDPHSPISTASPLYPGKAAGVLRAGAPVHAKDSSSEAAG